MPLEIVHIELRERGEHLHLEAHHDKFLKALFVIFHFVSYMLEANVFFF